MGQKKKNLLQNICRNNIVPPLSVTCLIEKIEGKTIIHVQVPKGRDKPYQTNKYQFLIRVGSTNKIASPQELMRLFQQSAVFHFDATGVANTAISDLNWAKLHQYFDQYGVDFSSESDKERLLVNTDIMTQDREVTIAGLLVFGINPQKFLHNASISFAHFLGQNIDDTLLDKKAIEGTLDIQIDTCVAVIKNNIKTPSVIEQNKTVDTVFNYPDKVFREIIVNACLHRNYSILGSRVRVFLFSDRLEIRSPGRLPNTVTTDKMKAGVSYATNPILLKFMENLRYIDKLGRGIPMVNQTALKNNKALILEEVGEEFVLILYL
ncbi:MAG: transcriptional regulator [Saprospiraceae bacterium]|nr:transcriptional regulator [Saprospiraceae bacterium]